MKAVSWKSLSVALVLLGQLTGCANPYVMKSDDTSLKEVVQRWSEASGRRLVWEIDDMKVVNPTGVNSYLAAPEGLTPALDKLINTAERARKLQRSAGEPPLNPVDVCVYKDTVRVSYHKGAAQPCS